MVDVCNLARMHFVSLDLIQALPDVLESVNECSYQEAANPTALALKAIQSGNNAK